MRSSATSRTVSLSPEKQALLRRRLQGRASAGASNIPRRRAVRAALSPAQLGMWVKNQFLETNALYSVPRVLQIPGSLDVDALRRALDALVERHETLRTTYPGQPSPVQHIGPPCPASLRIADVSLLPAQQRWSEAMRLALAEISTPFDLARGPVFRAVLITLGAGDADLAAGADVPAQYGQVLVLTTHHIATDGWSCTLLLRELDELYGAIAAGRDPDLAPLPIQYADYAHWQNQRVAQDQEQLAYWRAALEATPGVLELPTDWPRPTTASHRGDCAESSLSPQLSTKVRALAKNHGVTAYTVLLACFATVLRHYCGQQRFAVGSVLSGRNVAETEPLVGLFANVVALPMDLSGEPTFREVLRRAHDSVLGAFDHQDVTFDQVVSAVKADRAASRNPLYQVLFQCFEANERVEELPGLGAAAVSWAVQMAKVDLTLNAINGTESIDLTLNYATDLFTSATARRLLKYLANVVEHVVAHPGEFVTSTAVLGSAEADLVTRAWAGRRTGGPEADHHSLAHSVVSLFRAQAASAPQATALACGDQVLSYAELDKLTDRLADGLRTEGAGPGVVVGIALPRGIELAAAMLGVVKAGAAYLVLDPGLPVARVSFMLGDVGARLLVTDGNAAAASEGGAAGGPTAGAAKLLRFADLQNGDQPRAGTGLPAPMPDDLAYVVYTSGSSGAPKGVDITHRAVTNLLLGARVFFGAGPQDRWLALAPLSSDGLTMELFLPLVVGAHVVVAPESARMDGAQQRRLIREHGVTHLRAIPSGWRLLLAGDFGDQLAVAITTAEAMPVALARQVGARARRLVNAYGPTEATVHATYAEVPDQAAQLVIGNPIENVQVYLLDERMDPVPVGALGEICIGGAGLARGYHGRPGFTAQRFVPNPFGPPGSRLYRTGDRARYLPDGDMELHGRIDDQVKIRGYRVEPGEVEATMLAHQSVEQAAVVASAAPGGGMRLIGYFATSPAAGVEAPAAARALERELRDYLAGCLPSYLVPSRIAVLSRMPLTPTGKIDRETLSTAETLMPDTDASTAPRSDIERALARVWAAVLERDRIGLDDNFFDIGGDSLLAIYVVAGAREAGLAISPRQVLTQQTLGELAKVAEPIEAPRPRASAEPTPAPAECDTEQVDTDQLVAEYPLSPLQAGMVFHTVFDPESTEYLIQLVYTIEGELDVPTLRQAWEHAAVRHPILRTTFAWDDRARPVQLVHRHAHVQFRQFDWGGTPMAEVPARLTSHLARERLLSVDLERTPWRLDLIRTADGSYRLIWHGHHVLLDGWSRQVVLDEVRIVYRSLCETGALPCLREPVPFRHYIEWLHGHDPAVATAYWRATLADFREPTHLTILRPERGDRQGSSTQDVAALLGELPADVTLHLRQLADSYRITIGSVVHAAWALLLSRYGGGPDVVFGSTVSGRSGGPPGVERIVGLLINTLPVRVRLPQEIKAVDWLRDVHRQLVEQRDFEHCSLVDVQRLSQVPAGQQLFNTILMFENFASSHQSDGNGLTITPVQIWERTGYPLVLNVGLHAELRLRLDYQPARISADSAGRLMAHYQMLLASLAAEPDARLADLAPLPPGERNLVVGSFNDSAAVYPSGRCLHELFEEQADRTPAALAVMSGADTASYGELDERANRLAHYLRDMGVRPESLVGICVERSIDMVVAVLAVLKAGGAYVPLDPDYPAERLAFMLADTAAPVVLTQSGLIGRLPHSQARVVCLDGAGDADRIARCEPGRVRREVTPRGLSYVIYTSGSTGQPKGTLICHQGIVNYVWWMAENFPLAEGDRVLQLAGLSFDISVYEMFWPLSTGASVILARPDGYRDPHYIVDMMMRERITAAHLVPSMLRALLPLLDESRRLPLTWLFASAEAMTLDLVQEWEKRCPGTQLLNLYGATEVSVDSTAWSCNSSAGTVSVGRPIANTRVYVLDASGNPVPIGVAGEAYLAGDSVGRGYHGRPALTAKRFVPDPFGARGNRLYRTGDLVRWLPNGTLEFLGRLDHQVKIRGFRVELSEVESAMLTHPRLAQAAVTCEERTGSKRLVAYVVPSGERAPTTSELRAHLQARLPDYMVPAVFVTLPSLPLNPNGKVDRTALPAPEGSRPDLEAAFTAPRTPVEKILAGVWSGVLGMADIGVHDNFFELGGDSILSIQVMAAARRAGLTLTPRQMFANPSIAELAAAIDTSAEPVATHAEQGTVTGNVPLTPIQHWFTTLDIPHDHYNQSVRLRWDQPVATGALRRALATLVAHHDALRLRLRRAPGQEWRQHIAAAEPADLLRVADLSELSPDQLAAGVERAADELHSSLDLETGPLLRALLLRYGNGRPDELIVTVHHLTIDGVSWDILLDDLATVYHQQQRDEPSVLPAKTTSFQHWATRLAGYATSDEFAPEAAYWRMPRPAPRPLPADHADGANTEGSIATIARTLDPRHTQALLRSAHAAYRTSINDLLITALAQTLAGDDGRPAVQIDLEGHGREALFDDVDLSRTMGWFTSIHPLHIQLSHPLDPAHSIKTVKEHLHATPHHGVGYGIAQYLRPEPPGYPPAAISFNYHGQVHSSAGGGLFVRLGSVPGATRAGAGRRPYLIEINSVVVDGIFRVVWNYSTNVYRDETIAALADQFVDRLRALLMYCQAVVAERPAATPGREFLCRLFPGAPSTRLRMQRHHVPGVSLAVVADGALVDAWSDGMASAVTGVPVRPDTVFQAGSVSKHVTAMGVLRLARDRVVDLDEDVNRYLRTWRIPALDPDRTVTLRGLLSHTAGLTRDEFGGLGACHRDRPIPSLMDVLDGRPPAATAPIRPQLPPGKRFRYSGNHYVVVEQVLEDVTGLPFAGLMQELVFDPLGMRDSGYGEAFACARADAVAVGHDHAGVPVSGGWRVYPSATGGLWVSAGDLGRLAAELQRAHAGQGSVVLDRWAVTEILTPLADAAYGLGTVVRLADGVRWAGHTGVTAGYRCYTAFGLESGAGLVVMSNSDAGTDFAVDLLVDLGAGFHAWAEQGTDDTRERSRRLG